jgi:aspartyl protease family protein
MAGAPRGDQANPAGLPQAPARRRLAALALACWLPALQAVAAGPLAQPEGVVLAGRMGDRALLVIDGQPHMLAPGGSVAGVSLLRWDAERAQVSRDGTTGWLEVGTTPAQVSGTAKPRAGREVVIPVGPGGHFATAGSINGHAVRFMVDTGATLVSLGVSDAARLGLDLSQARQTMTQTANGAVPVQIVTLDSVRVGDIELNNVGAAVVPTPMPLVLLGNSFLARVNMERVNDRMKLQLR